MRIEATRCRIAGAFVFILLTACSNAPSTPSSIALPSESETIVSLQGAETAHEQARALFEQGHYLDALPLAKKAVSIREGILGPTHEDVATALTTLGLIHGTLIELSHAKPLLERALDIRRSLFGPSDSRVGESLTDLATVLYAGGDFVGAIRTLEDSLAIRERTLGSSHPDVAVTLTHLAIAERGMSRLERARTKTERAIAILRTTQPSKLRDLAMAVNVAGNILARQGNFEQARSLLGESLQLYEHAVGSQHPHVAGALMQMAMLEGKQGNFAAALPLLERALLINERSYGKDNPEVAGNLHELGLAERALGMVASAQQRFEQSLQIQEATVGAGHPFVALTLVELAEGKRLQGDAAAARALLQRALQLQETSLGKEHTTVATTLMRLGHLEVHGGNLSTAERYFERATRIRERALGATHPDVAASLLDVARAKHAQGALSDARPLYEQARVILQAQAGKNPGLDDDTLARLWKRDIKGLQDYALLLAMLAHTSTDHRDRHSAVADGFTVSQQARGWLMQAAVAKALAQGQAGSQGEVVLARQLDHLRRERQEAWNRLSELYGLPENQRDASDLSSAQARLADIQHELDRVTSQLQSVAPRYAETAQPEALDIPRVQRLLRPHELLVSFYTLADRVQVWAIRSQGATVYGEAKIDRISLLKSVQRLRSSLMPTVDPTTKESMLVAYDVETAADLYQKLFDPVRAAMTDVQQLILVPDDALLPIPFAALLTQREGESFTSLAHLHRQQHSPTSRDIGMYAALYWLAKSYPITVLPSASALKLLRQYSIAATSQTEPFVGFGDPVLQGKGTQRGGSMIATRGMRVAVDSLRKLDNLPGTRQELLTVASLLHVNPETSVYLGERATEPEVRRLNHSGRLGRAKVISFATHGLLAGEVQGVTQPALVLTPPQAATDDNDGLLSMEDVLQLKLPNTEWVILSACNTGGEDGSGESLSGLARAFFYAGAKSLLVSQWSVDDDATRALMSAVFSRYGAPRATFPAKALQDGMLALLEQAGRDPARRYFAHPYAWAAFMLVGEGAIRN